MTLWKIPKPNLCVPQTHIIFGSVFDFVNFRKVSILLMDSFKNFGLYRNLENVLDELTDAKHNGIEAVQELLTIFNNTKQKLEEKKPTKNYPLIIMEGLDGSGKSAMTRRLASKLYAWQWSTPPKSTQSLRNFFDSDLSLRAAYYSLGNYIASMEVSCILADKPVVMDRYWHSTTACALGQAIANNPHKLTLPEKADEVYKWPSDLLKPDIVFLLVVDEEVRLERHSRRNAASVTTQEKLMKDDIKFRQDVIQAYKNMRDPGVVLIDGNGSIPRTLRSLMQKAKPLVE